MTDIPRREALGLGAGFGAATLLSRHSPSPHPARVVFGINLQFWDQARSAVPLVTAVRVPCDTYNEVPTSWLAPAGSWPTLAIRPWPSDLLSGKLDTAIKDLIHAAPPHAELTFWHENTSGNPFRYPRNVNDPHTYRMVQRKGHELCSGTGVRYGTILLGPHAQQADRIEPGANDWIADDLYAWPRLRDAKGRLSRARVLGRMQENYVFWQQMTKRKYPRIRICETNSQYDGERAEFLTWLAWFCGSRGGARIMSFYNPAGQLSGPWPPSAATISTWNVLAGKYQ